MKNLFTGGRRKVAAVMAIALFTSLSPVAPIDAASKANNLVILVGEKDAGWCSQDSPGLDQIAMKNAVSEGLMTMNSEGKVVPYLLKSVSSSADYKTWTLTLREGIFFHDAEQWSAASLAANLAAALGLTVTGSLPAIAWQDLFGGVTSFAAFAAKVQVKSAFIVQLNLPAPRPDVPSILYGSGRFTMWSSATLKSPKCGTTVGFGTGPFKIVEKGIDQFTTKLEANPNYWRKAADGSKLPKAKTVTFKTVLDATQRVNALEKGSADIASFGSTSGAQIKRAQKDLKSKITVIAGAKETTWALHMNTAIAPFNNKNARMAVSFAIDRVNYAKLMTRSLASPATSLGASYHPYYVKNTGVRFDLAKAKEYVAAYKKDTGKDLVVVIPITDTTESAKSNGAIAKFLEAAGIKTSLMAPVTSTQYILRGFALRQQWSWFNVVAGNDASFASLFSTKTDLELSGFRFTNPGLAQCFVDARASGDAKNYKTCAAVLHGEAYWIPVYTESGYLMHRNKVSGIGATPLPNGGKRQIISLAGFDFASVTVSG